MSEEAGPKKPGRPSAFTQEIADAICEGLLEGRSMRQVCSDEGMPHRSTVLRWMAESEDFATKCARARELQSDLMDDLVLETAHACTPETAVADRVKIAAFQWRASKLAPKKYGDKVENTHLGPNGGPVESNITVTFVAPKSETA